MVSLAFVLFMVSTLASLTNAFPQEQPVVRDECGNKTFCHIKPANYPQEEIDRLALKHLPQLRRMRRHIVKAADPEYGGNCYPKVKNTTVFTMRDHTSKGPKYFVNSKWYVQNITEVECEEQKVNSSCFKEYVVSNDIQTKCETRKVTVKLLVYNPDSKELEPVTTPIGVDCACVIKKS